MTRWLAFGAFGAAVVAGGVHGYERAVTPSPELSPPAAVADWGIPPAEQHPTAPDELSADDLFQETATHEAGHWAAARAARVPVLEVSAEDTGAGETVWLTPRDAYDRAVIDAAGEEAAIAWLEQHGYTHDRAVDEAEPHARSDLAQLRIDARQAGISETQAHDGARQLVRDHQAAINSLAARLIERGGHLDERELNDEWER